MLSTVRPSVVRKSWAYLANDSGLATQRRKSKSRFLTGLYCKVAGMLGR
ncbi:MAG: hypothetical protein GY794_21205 [bacterium]|nr:hypothetical protein [bacterium]